MINNYRSLACPTKYGGREGATMKYGRMVKILFREEDDVAKEITKKANEEKQNKQLLKRLVEVVNVDMDDVIRELSEGENTSDLAKPAKKRQQFISKFIEKIKGLGDDRQPQNLRKAAGITRGVIEEILAQLSKRSERSESLERMAGSIGLWENMGIDAIEWKDRNKKPVT
jgi:hypothetical protein